MDETFDVDISEAVTALTLAFAVSERVRDYTRLALTGIKQLKDGPVKLDELCNKLKEIQAEIEYVDACADNLLGSSGQEDGDEVDIPFHTAYLPILMNFLGGNTIGIPEDIVKQIINELLQKLNAKGLIRRNHISQFSIQEEQELINCFKNQKGSNGIDIKLTANNNPST